MTPYGDRHQKNEYSLGSVTTAEVAEPPSTEQEEPPADDDDEEDEDEPAGEYVCPDCGRGFATEHGLKIHTGKAHPEET